MNEILTLVTFLALLFYTGIEMKFQLQMLQQNSYRNDRYNRWLKGESFASVSRLTDLFLLLLLSTNFLPTFVQIVTITVVLAKSVKGLQTKYKKPLVFTKRATRLYIAVLLLSLLIAGLAAGLTTLSNGSRALLAIAILAPYFMVAANIIMQPVEKRINRKYYDEAKQILSQMQDLTVIGITGSYGKTSTKHYLYRILCERYNVLMTPGSFNTPMGVIRTIREQMKPYHNIFICEMGAKQIGDIKEICDLVAPQIGIITAVGEQHLESFKTIGNVQRTKFELVDALPGSGLAVINNDFPYIANRPVENVPVKRYTIADTGADYHIEDIRYDTECHPLYCGRRWRTHRTEHETHRRVQPLQPHGGSYHGSPSASACSLDTIWSEPNRTGGTSLEHEADTGWNFHYRRCFQLQSRWRAHGSRRTPAHDTGETHHHHTGYDRVG